MEAGYTARLDDDCQLASFSDHCHALRSKRTSRIFPIPKIQDWRTTQTAAAYADCSRVAEVSLPYASLLSLHALRRMTIVW